MTQQHQFVVAKNHPGASDSGSGTVDQPFSTISKAASLARPGDTIVIGAGIYRETVAPARSGTESAPIVFRGVPGEPVVISGTEPVGCFTSAGDSIYKATVEMDLDPDEVQLFYDGTMMVSARWPDAGGWSSDHLLEFEKAVAKDGTTRSRIVDPQLPNWNWQGAKVWVSSNRRWGNWTTRVTGFGPGYLEVEDHADAKGNIALCPGGFYYVFNARDALTSPGEWFYDWDQKTLYIRTPDGVEPGARVEVKQRTVAFDLCGRSNIVLQGLRIHAASVAFDPGSQHHRLDRLVIHYPFHSTKAENQYGSQARSGLVVEGGQHQICDCEIAYSSGTGLYLGGHDLWVVNNYIHDHNYIGTFSANVLFGCTNTVFSHNTLCRSGRSLMSGRFFDSLVQYNRASCAGYLTDDLGLTYFNKLKGGGSEIRYNWFHDNFAQQKSHNFGIYLDHGCENVCIHHNVVWGVHRGGLMNNMSAQYLLWYNNTVTTEGDESIISPWAAAMEQDVHGSHWVNNLASGGIGIKGVGGTVGYNKLHYQGLVNYKFPSKRIPSPVSLGGVIGTGPYVGAYPDGEGAWIPGHNFDNPPTEVDLRRSQPLHRNLLYNGSVQSGKLAPWQVKGMEVSVNTQSTNQWDVDQTTLCSFHSLRLGAGNNEAFQTVSDLIPGASYQFMVKLRVAAGEIARIGVRQANGEELLGEAIAGTNALWQKQTVEFTVAPGSEQVAVFIRKESAGEGDVFCDAMGLQYRADQ